MGSFFGNIFGGEAGKEAAARTREYLDKVKNEGMDILEGAYGVGRGDLTYGYDAGRNALGYGYDAATDYLTGGLDNAYGYLDSGYDAAGRLVSQGGTDAQNYLDTAEARSRGLFDRSRGDLTDALGDYKSLDDLARKYGVSTSLLQDALGANGPEAAARARQAFETSLSYDFTRDEGIEAINRRRAAAGMLASGNADRDATIYAAGLASKESGDWLDRLAGFREGELDATKTAATGRAGVRTNMAQLGATEADQARLYGTARSGIATDIGKTLGGYEAARGTGKSALASQSGKDLAALAYGAGRDTAGTYTDEGRTLADLVNRVASRKVDLSQGLSGNYAKTYSDEANAEMAGNTNLWNFGQKVVSGIANAAGSGGFGGFGGGGGGGDLGYVQGLGNFRAGY